MTPFFIRFRIGPTDEYDCIAEATSFADVVKQVEALEAGLRLADSAAAIELLEISKSRTRGRDYTLLGKWTRA